MPLPELPGTAPDAPVAAPLVVAEVPRQDSLPAVSRRYVLLLMLAGLGTSMAFVAGSAYSLAIRIQQLAPGQAEVLGYITGLGGVVSLIATPLVGVLSDRTRSRWGRRRPFLVAGTLLGLLAQVVLGLAPNIVVLGAGWLLAALGYGQVLGTIGSLQADKLPEHQRGKVSGLTGTAQLLAPVLGVALATTLVGSSVLLFLVPGLAGLVLIIPLWIWAADADTRKSELPSEHLTVARLFGKYLFDPRRYPDFAWNGLGRFAFYCGLYFNTTYMTFFIAQHQNADVTAVGGVVVALGGAGVIATALGALGGGMLSDRLRRRRLFVLLSGALFAFGAVLMVSSSGLVPLIVGSAFTNLGMGVFAAVDQAIVLDVLPSREEAGRYLGIINYTQQLPHALAPLAAGGLLAIGAADGTKNYDLVYLVGGALTLVGGAIVMAKVRKSR
ncbi:MFS transporter [Amycolatopsis sp. NPDC021455]|uniref:MFS transporter n=1 Tax=Amycolatopsis sp. NPDC021455 TaxID=3154901 RepID=UPI0033C2627D